MSPSQSKLPSHSIKVVPGRSKLRVESSNPVARGNPVPRPSKVKPIPPEEVMKLHSGVSKVPVPQPSVSSRPYKPARPTFESSRLKPTRPTFESSRFKHALESFESQRREPVRVTFESPIREPVRATFESPRREPVRATFESPRREPVRATFESPRREPVRATFESPRPTPARATVEAPRHIPARPASKPPRPVSARPTYEPPRPVPARPGAGVRKEIVCGLRAASSMNTTTVRRRTNPSSLHQPRTAELPLSPSALQSRSKFQLQATTDPTTHTIEETVVEVGDKARTVDLPPSPRALQIPSIVQQQATTTDATTHTIEETVVEVGDKAKDDGSKETCRSTSEERISELLLCRPALLPTWKGRIVDSATLPEFDCQFRANPPSNIRMKALRLSKAMPIFLEVELVPTGRILNNLFGRIPRLSDVELYFFLNEKETERSKREHAHLFEAMVTRNAMIKASVNGTELLIFSSKLLDKTSQFFIKKQTKTENYLWGFFLHNKNSQAHVPVTSYQDDSNVVDMDIDPEDQTPGLTLQPIAVSQSSYSNLPPGFGKMWIPPPYSRPWVSSGERPYWS